MKKEEEFLQLFPAQMQKDWACAAQEADRIQEVRLRTGRPVFCLKDGNSWYLGPDGKLTRERENCRYIKKGEIEQILNHITHNSLYAYQEQISQGFLSLPGGSRIGLAGQAILENGGGVRNLRDISSLNIRLSHEKKGTADAVLPFLYENGRVCHTLLVSPPGCGKTTMLRDLIRQISDGSRFGEGRSVGVVDERSEICSCYQGVPQNDVGMRTDILDACPKAMGMMMLLRSMAPEVIAVDELGCSADMEALAQVLQCGCSIIATLHGRNREELLRKPFLQSFLRDKIFERYLFLEKKGGRYLVGQILDRELQPWHRS